MTESFEVTKVDAGQRQLALAIRMLFNGHDPIAVHTLAGAASIIFTDLVEKLAPEFSWDRMAQEDSNIAAQEYFQIVRKAQNYLKHAGDDRNEKLVFDPTDTESLIMLAVMNASEVAPMTKEAQVYLLWFLAGRCPPEVADQSPFREAVEFFGDLRQTTRAERMRLGKQALA